MTRSAIGPLDGVRIVEIAGIGPAPFCGMLLADLGADVVVVDRTVSNNQIVDLGPSDITGRGKRKVRVDLKSADEIARILDLIGEADALIEGMRPGVMERLGLGPDICLARNPRLAYGRMTGWGQEGPLAQSAGHDINYIGVSGALWYSSAPGEAPVAPPTLAGDVGGGALYLAVGVLAAIMAAKATGRGQVIDAAIVDGSAHMMNLLLSLQAVGQLSAERGQSLVDGPPWYATYCCADGAFISLGALEPKFHAEFCERLGLTGNPDFAQSAAPADWPAMRRRYTDLFARYPAAHWCALLEGTDACFSPVLAPQLAAQHPHMAARQTYARPDGVLQAMPAPRFSEHRTTACPRPVQIVDDTDTIIAEWTAKLVPS